MRYIEDEVTRCLKIDKKMSFIAGPRQVGKTTFAKHLLEQVGSTTGYFNWDIPEDRKKIIKNMGGFWKSDIQDVYPRIVLDEIHKYPRWKRFLKGLYDDVGKQIEIIVTGSGHLNVYQRGGDSLFGRHFLFRLHPFSVGEMLRPNKSALLDPEKSVAAMTENTVAPEATEAMERLEMTTGFPEPLFGDGAQSLQRWRQARRTLILLEDLRDLTRIREIGLMDSLVSLLPERVGSLLSVNALREDLGLNFNTVSLWLRTLEHLYYLFEIRPFSGKLTRTLRRGGKFYLYDGTEIASNGARFENSVALHLMKACDAWTDFGAGDFKLHYVRDKEKREVDFLITERRKPWMLVECKLSEKETDRSLVYFQERLKPKYTFQVVRGVDRNFCVKTGASAFVIGAPRFLAALP